MAQLTKPVEGLPNEGATETLQINNRLSKYYAEANETELSEVTTFLSTAFTKRISKEVWSDLIKSIPQ